jgi:hypothetical protein
MYDQYVSVASEWRSLAISLPVVPGILLLVVRLRKFVSYETVPALTDPFWATLHLGIIGMYDVGDPFLANEVG